MTTTTNKMKTAQKRQLEQTKDKFYSIIAELENTLELMPIKGLKAEQCQRTFILNKIHALDSSINGIKIQDFTPNEYSEDFKLSYS